jgi:hypothetical protein
MLIRNEKNLLYIMSNQSHAHTTNRSIKLSNQILDAFWILLRELEVAYCIKTELQTRTFQELARKNPKEIYDGILTFIMRLLFMMYVEERIELKNTTHNTTEQHQSTTISIRSLLQTLKKELIEYSTTMKMNNTTWIQLLLVTRLIYNEGEYQGIKIATCQDGLFDPKRFPFLEGFNQTHSSFLYNKVPMISDLSVYHLLRCLFFLNGEKVSYSALGIEEIGSIYESMMKYQVEYADTDCVVLKPRDEVIRLKDLLAVSQFSRKKWLKKYTSLQFSKDQQDQRYLKLLQDAQNEDDLFNALKSKLSDRCNWRLSIGSLYLKSGEKRRKSGSHYTPVLLSRAVVHRALDPHIQVINTLSISKREKALLDLKICDLAMGTGVFLIEVCRQLANLLVEVWEILQIQKDVSTKNTKIERSVAILEARRKVAYSCLYGVDKNPYAVSLAKVSLSLFIWSTKDSLNFLDHALRCGDALIGLSNESLNHMQWRVSSTSIVNDDQSLDKVLISSLWNQIMISTSERKMIANALIATFFTQNKKQREKDRCQLIKEIKFWSQCKSIGNTKKSAFYFSLLNNRSHALSRLGLSLTPFHWHLEFPKVFRQGGFDVIVGNPPFMGKNTLINAHHHYYIDWLKTVHEGTHGNADLVAHFFRKAYVLLRNKGTFGFISTNTIAQGDTRATGLTWLCSHAGALIYDATRRNKWPGDATVVVSTIHIIKRMKQSKTKRKEKNLDFHINKKLDGRQVDHISAFLTPGMNHSMPHSLNENRKKSFIGSYILGLGFTFKHSKKSTPYNQKGVLAIGTPTSIADMMLLIKKKPKNKKCIFPYIGGKELNTHPNHQSHRYVINFGMMNEREARQWQDLMGIVERKVKPERDQNKRAVRKKYWWRYGETAPKLYESIKDMDRVIARSLTSTHFTFTFLENTFIYDQTLIVFALNSYASFCCLTSSIHETWSHVLGATLGDGPRYSITKCFENFPFPSHRDSNIVLNQVGKVYYEFRAQLMADQSIRDHLMNGLVPEGMTQTYNHFHDQTCTYEGIIRLRKLHQEVDRAVANAYGWFDLILEYDWIDHYSGIKVTERLKEFTEYEEIRKESSSQEIKPRYTFIPTVKDEIMERLLTLNMKRIYETFD